MKLLITLIFFFNLSQASAKYCYGAVQYQCVRSNGMTAMFIAQVSYNGDQYQDFDCNNDYLADNFTREHIEARSHLIGTCKNAWGLESVSYEVWDDPTYMRQSTAHTMSLCRGDSSTYDYCDFVYVRR